MLVKAYGIFFERKKNFYAIFCVFFKKSFQFPAETDRILSSGRKMHRPAAHGMDLILESHRIIGIAKEIKMKPAAVDPPVIVHKKTFHPAGVLCHTENKDIIHDCHDLRCQFSKYYLCSRYPLIVFSGDVPACKKSILKMLSRFHAARSVQPWPDKWQPLPLPDRI